MTLSRSKKNYNPGQESVRHWITTLVLVTVNIATIFPCVDWIDRIPAPTTWNEDRVSRFRPAFTDIRSRYGSQHYSIIKGEFDGFRVTFATFDWFLRSMAIHIDCTCRWGPTDTWFLSNRIRGENFSSRRLSRILRFSWVIHLFSMIWSI